MSFIHRIESEAKAAATVKSVDPERKKAFLEGAVFAIKYLKTCMSVHPMETTSVENFLDKMRLKDVREAVSYLLQGVDNEL